MYALWLCRLETEGGDAGDVDDLVSSAAIEELRPPCSTISEIVQLVCGFGF